MELTGEQVAAVGRKIYEGIREGNGGQPLGRVGGHRRA